MVDTGCVRSVRPVYGIQNIAPDPVVGTLGRNWGILVLLLTILRRFMNLFDTFLFSNLSRLFLSLFFQLLLDMTAVFE